MVHVRPIALVLSIGMLAVMLLGTGCGGGSKESSEANEEKGTAELRHTCLEAREGLHIPAVMRSTCMEVGVTQSSPPPSSSEAQEAARSTEEESSRIETKEAERPVYERQRRSAALLDLSRGNRSLAERELEEGCPKADSGELSEAWWALQRLAHASPEPSLAELEGALDELCPL
jgi:hypothetical protein